MKLSQIERPKLLDMLLNLILNGQVSRVPKIIDKMIEAGNTKVLAMINETISSPAIINRLIELIINNKILWNKVKDNSYRHENGFHKVVLLSGEYFKLRMHQFGDLGKMPMENIHDHRWPFASAILSGELMMDIFQRSSSGLNSEILHHFVYKSDKTSGRYDTEYIGLSYLQKIERRIYFSGDTYLMDTDVLHRITNQNADKSITLILTGKPISKECNLFSRKKILEEEKMLSKYTDVELRHMLEDSLEIIYPQKN